jgi:hypothetical protein
MPFPCRSHAVPIPFQVTKGRVGRGSCSPRHIKFAKDDPSTLPSLFPSILNIFLLNPNRVSTDLSCKTEAEICYPKIASVVDKLGTVNGTFLKWYWGGKSKYFGEKPVAVSICPPRIRMWWLKIEPGTLPEGSAINFLSHCTALYPT